MDNSIYSFCTSPPEIKASIMTRRVWLLLGCMAAFQPCAVRADILPAVLTVKAHRYILGPGDKLRLSLYGQREFDADATVDVAGNIAVPLLGSVRATGHSLVDLSARIEQALMDRDYYLSPHVTIALVQARPFMIEGDVAKPGGYPFEANLTVRRAFVWAGGYGSTPKMSLITGLRSSARGLQNTTPMIKIYRKVDGATDVIVADENTFIEPGDLVSIVYSLTFLTRDK